MVPACISLTLMHPTVGYCTLGAAGTLHQGAGSKRLSSIASSTVAVMMQISESMSIIV